MPATVIGKVLDGLRDRLGPSFDPVEKWRGKPDLMASAGRHLWKQKWWTDALGKATMDRLIDSADARDQARMLEQSVGVFTACMRVLPDPALHTIINPEEYSLALKWWLGVFLFTSCAEATCCPGCGAGVDACGDHLVCCQRNNCCLRHTAIQNAVADVLILAG